MAVQLLHKKQKGHTETGRLHNKKPKVETPSTVNTPEVVTVPHSNQPAPLPEEVMAKQLDSHQVSAIPSDKENLPVISDVTQLSVSYNPMSLLAVAADKEDYNNEAKQLVKDNGWVKAIIENGKLY
ncbi:hypothetical protein PISMIDRAFT_16486 [Pisolithus microcarpus 441]|uniref:Uncharacterized protein n=1 Tax=Pisolithus microcarpus 441 TaxID=765257 RepID=A0A0C9YZE6_9AGAM|nr:hypothetical protein BKA83DRAFT_16486 [Pisolithus microcarpus]KIK15472.1 hypothetical protein PISMIDRAFT_16486 [Pisolithus microcarpus 441]